MSVNGLLLFFIQQYFWTYAIRLEKAMSSRQKNFLESCTLSYNYLNTLPSGNEGKKWQIQHCSDINTESPFQFLKTYFPGGAKKDLLSEIITFNKEAQSGNSKSYALNQNQIQLFQIALEQTTYFQETQLYTQSLLHEHMLLLCAAVSINKS